MSAQFVPSARQLSNDFSVCAEQLNHDECEAGHLSITGLVVIEAEGLNQNPNFAPARARASGRCDCSAPGETPSRERPAT